MVLRLKQQRFCEEYIKDFNGTQSAIRAGYSKKTAYAIASENLRKPEIQACIKKLMEEACLSADETKKMLSDISRSSLNDYFTIKKVERTPRIEIFLTQHVKVLQDEIKFEEEYASQAGYSEDEWKAHNSSMQYKKRVILRHELVLKENSKAKIIVDGPTEWVEIAELDMVKLVADKERGRIKAINPGQYGTKIELMGADVALVNVARIHGLFEKDNKQGQQIIVPMNDDQVDKVIAELKKLK